MAKGIRQRIPSAAARAGARPGAAAPQPRTSTAPAQAQQQDKRLAQIVEQGGVGVWKVKGTDAPIYALSRDQAQAEAQRRGVQGSLVLQGYVKLSEADRATLQDAAAQVGGKRMTAQAEQRQVARDKRYGTPADVRAMSNAELRRLYDKDPKTANAEAQRRGLVQEWFDFGEGKRDFRFRRYQGVESDSIGEAVSGISEKDREFTESRGGVVGIVSEAEAARAEASSKPNVMQYAQGTQEAAVKSVSPYVKQVPWRHTVVTQIDWPQMVSDMGEAKAERTLRQMGYSGADAATIVSEARAVGEAQKYLAPYTDQFGRIDVIEAARNRVPDSAFFAVGIDADTIADARFYADSVARLAPQETGPVTPLTDRLMMNIPAQPPSAKRYEQFMYRAYLEPYKVRDNEYNLKAAIDAGVDTSALLKAGFPITDVLKALAAEQPRKASFAGAQAMAAKGTPEVDYSSIKPEPAVQKAGVVTNVLLLPYRNRDGSYDLVRMVEGGKVSSKQMQEAGFTNEQVSAAIRLAQQRSTEKWTAELQQGMTGAMDPASIVPSKVGVAGLAVRATLVPYLNRDGSYDLVRAVQGGKTYRNMSAAGFSDEQITAAINAAMRASAAAAATESVKGGAAIQDVMAPEARRVTDARAADIAKNLMMHADPDIPEDGIIAPQIQRLQQWLNDNTKGTSPALRVAGGVAAGMTFALMPIAVVDDLFVTSGAETKAEKAKGYVKGSVNYFLTLPAAFLNDPYWTMGEVAGMVAGPKAALRAARTARVWVDPYGVPARAVGIEFSCGKVGIKGLNTLDLGRALAEAQRQVMTGKLSGKVRVGEVEVSYRGTPIQNTVGEVVFSATPDVTPFAGKGVVRVGEGGLYTSPYLAQRFMATSGVGTAATKPGVVAILTDASRVRNAPKASLRRVSESERFVLQADQGLLSPSKIWRYQFETEITAAPGTTFTKAPSNLRTRILGEKAGEFFVQYDGPTMPGITKGQLVPVHVFLDQGVYRTAPSPGALYAAKLLTIYESLKDFGQRLSHPSRTIRDALAGRDTPGIREIEANHLRQNAALVRELEKEARAAAPALARAEKISLMEAYRKALADAYSRRATQMYSEVGRAADAAYERAPERFEAAYRARLESNLRVASRTMTLGRAYETVRTSRRLPERTVAELPRWMREARTEPERPMEERGVERTRQPAREARGEPRESERVAPRELETLRVAREIPLREDRQPVGDSIPRRIPVPGLEEEGGTTQKKPDSIAVKETRRFDPTGRVQWKQGAYWIMVEPPPVEGERQRNVQYSRRPFWGVRKVKGNPEETFAKQGKPPREFLYEMGVTKARIFSYEKPHLRWRQTGAATRRRRRGKVI